MNKRQCLILTLGLIATLLVPILGRVQYNPPLVGPLVEDSPGHYSQKITYIETPKWTLLASLGIFALTITAVHKTRTQPPITPPIPLTLP